VTDSRLISDADGDCRFEATVTGELIASRLVRHGGSPRSMHADATGTEITVDVSTTGTDVREFVEMLREGYPTVELRSRRHVERSMGTRRELVTSLFEALTDRPATRGASHGLLRRLFRVGPARAPARRSQSCSR